MDLTNYSVKNFLLNEAKSAIQSIVGANEKNLAHGGDQGWNMIAASIHEPDRDPKTKIREIEFEEIF